MTQQKKDTTVLLTTLVATMGVVGVLYLFFGQILGTQTPRFFSQKTDTFTSINERQNTNQSLTFAQVRDVPTGLFRYGGSTTWAPIRRDLDSQLRTVFPNLQLVYSDPISEPPGSTPGIKMVLNNQLAFSQSSRPIRPEEFKTAESRGFKLKEIPVAIDGIAIASHPNLNIPGLTIAQIRDIYTGKITNWRQISGPNLPIVPYSRRLSDGGTVEFFHENVLGKTDFGKNVQFISTTTQAVRAIAKQPGAIFYASAPEIVDQCSIKPLPIGREINNLVTPYQEPFVPLSQCPKQRNQINVKAFQNGDYPITRNLFVVVKENNQIDQQLGEGYAQLLLTNQGQELINQTGFVRIR